MKRRLALALPVSLALLATSSLALAADPPTLPAPWAEPVPAAEPAPAAQGSTDAPPLPAPPPSARPGPETSPSAPAVGASAPATVATTPEKLPEAEKPLPREAPPPFVSATAGLGSEPSRPLHELRFGVGLRFGYVSSSGYDTFSKNDVLPQFSVEGTYALLEAGKFSFALGAAYDVGGSSDGLRGKTSSLLVHRLTVPLEGRFHATRGVLGFVRVAPGAAAFVARVTNPATDDLRATPWAFATDVSVGGSFLIGPQGRWEKRQARFWVTPELGYAFTTKASVRPTLDSDTETRIGTLGATDLGQLSTSGLFWRVALAMSF